MQTVISDLLENKGDTYPYITELFESIEEYYVGTNTKPDTLYSAIKDLASGLFTNDSSMYSPQSNTIKKAYICHANTKQIRPGDILFFYRTQDRKSIECIGVVEHTYRGQEVDKVTPLVSKRTVYSREEIKEMLKKNALTILFRFLGNFPPIKYKALEEAGIEGHIQSIRQITHDEYINIFNQEAS